MNDLLPGWICSFCRGFNGEAKEIRDRCRACDAERADEIADTATILYDVTEHRCGPQLPCGPNESGCPAWDTASATVKVRWGREEETYEGFGLPIATISVPGRTESEARLNMRKLFQWVRTEEPFPWPFYVRWAIALMLMFRRVRTDIYALLFRHACGMLLLKGSNDSVDTGQPGDVLDWSIETDETGHSHAYGSRTCNAKDNPSLGKGEESFLSRLARGDRTVADGTYRSEPSSNGGCGEAGV